MRPLCILTQKIEKFSTLTESDLEARHKRVSNHTQIVPYPCQCQKNGGFFRESQVTIGLMGLASVTVDMIGSLMHTAEHRATLIVSFRQACNIFDRGGGSWGRGSERIEHAVAVSLGSFEPIAEHEELVLKRAGFHVIDRVA